MKISIKGIDKAELLAALYNAARPLGMGMLRCLPGDMSIEEARKCLGMGDDHARDFPEFVKGDRKMYFDYLHGRPLKVDLSGDEMSTDLYDRDQGKGAAERIVAALREKMERGQTDASHRS